MSFKKYWIAFLQKAVTITSVVEISDENTVHPALAMLIQHEIVLADLYQACTVAFPDDIVFWETLVQEEKAHANVLQELALQLRTQTVYLNERKFNVLALQTAIDHIENRKAAVQSESLTLLQTLASALDIERAVIEKEFYRIFDTDSAAIRQEFMALKTHTAEHAARIANKLEQARLESE